MMEEKEKLCISGGQHWEQKETNPSKISNDFGDSFTDSDYSLMAKERGRDSTCTMYKYKCKGNMVFHDDAILHSMTKEHTINTPSFEEEE